MCRFLATPKPMMKDEVQDYEINKNVLHLEKGEGEAWKGFHIIKPDFKTPNNYKIHLYD